ncbi:MAG: hypothetical protein HY518_00630 [Candidatus Aenigmarchaeota archaeon]|nr:hypothetical protein [Candidatus Aenigmarchaeota archaeon]
MDKSIIPIILVSVIVSIVVAVMFGQKDSVPDFTDEDMKRGWYWGQSKDKRPGTPDSWMHEAEGTRGAKWVAPVIKTATGEFWMKRGEVVLLYGAHDFDTREQPELLKITLMKVQDSSLPKFRLCADLYAETAMEKKVVTLCIPHNEQISRAGIRIRVAGDNFEGDPTSHITIDATDIDNWSKDSIKLRVWKWLE